ncbi:threonine aldolase family protein [Paenibacillus protaetiae]|uniref:Low specificity L-threonine aldolase n=1 Tax=Paenibacillus protaetiae TaxID=2509456 RepID=A0A4P6EYV2_9BACL|nr:beta-eliminating lyase-related protein [Paenibacillus protaetiae]QAY65867.1 low specificity L-threonine aldolase [Paenibacillus protaetiae]
MSEHKKSLTEVFNASPYPLAGHGKRNMQVLKNVFEQIDGSTDSDMYGKGAVIEQFEQRMAAYLGKPSAVFFPSGTMAQQIALRLWSDEAGNPKVAYHPLCHLEIHEQDGLRQLHRLEPVLLADKDRLITLEDVKQLQEPIACLLLELPQREIGGQLPSFEELAELSAYCRANGIKLHLDGARLFEVTPYYGKSAAEICELFDSVYVSFYKGIGGIAGAVLAGETPFTEQSKVWKRRHGGDLISLYPYIVSSEHYFNERIGKMALYYEQAVELASLYNEIEGVSTRPEVPVSNMFHVHIQYGKEQTEAVLAEVCSETGVGLSSYARELGERQCYYEVSIGDRYSLAPKADVQKAFQLLGEKLSKLSR